MWLIFNWPNTDQSTLFHLHDSQWAAIARDHMVIYSVESPGRTPPATMSSNASEPHRSYALKITALLNPTSADVNITEPRYVHNLPQPTFAIPHMKAIGTASLPTLRPGQMQPYSVPYVYTTARPSQLSPVVHAALQARLAQRSQPVVTKQRQSTPEVDEVSGTNPYARSPRLKLLHKMAERKRRSNLRNVFDELKEVLCEDEAISMSKSDIVDVAVSTIDSLHIRYEKLLREKEALCSELRCR